MDSFEWNKIFAALLVAVLASQLIGWFSDVLYHNDPPEKPAYAINVPGEEDDAATDQKAEPAEPQVATIAVRLQDASADKGARAFRRCQACHKIADGGQHGVGPDLYNVVGSDIAGKDGYNYSTAVAGLDGQWTYANLDRWLTDPQAMGSGSKMVMKVGDPEDRADLIAYLRANTDNPPPLPDPAGNGDDDGDGESDTAETDATADPGAEEG
ncbi:c-type cytochrome [Rhodothalassium salexigens]|uniref:c-type cytochrome n=1 Tax=Rhodothalassium salexigens TaxID=1086 RepID=UPI001912D0E8